MNKNVLIYGGLGVLAVGVVGYMLMTANPGGAASDDNVSDAGAFFPTTMFAPGSLNAQGSYSTDDSLSQLLEQQATANTQSYNLQMEQLASQERMAKDTNTTQLSLADINKETTVTTALASQLAGIVSGMGTTKIWSKSSINYKPNAVAGVLGYKDGQIFLNVADNLAGQAALSEARNTANIAAAKTSTTPATAA